MTTIPCSHPSTWILTTNKFLTTNRFQAQKTFDGEVFAGNFLFFARNVSCSPWTLWKYRWWKNSLHHFGRHVQFSILLVCPSEYHDKVKTFLQGANGEGKDDTIYVWSLSRANFLQKIFDYIDEHKIFDLDEYFSMQDDEDCSEDEFKVPENIYATFNGVWDMFGCELKGKHHLPPKITFWRKFTKSWRTFGQQTLCRGTEWW